jgi:DNA-binding NtrC family response regulator
VKKTWDEQLSREGSSASEADTSVDDDFEERRRATSFFGLPQINSPVWVQALAEENIEEVSDDVTAADAVPVDEAELDLSVQQQQQQVVISSGESGIADSSSAAATAQPDALELSAALETLCQSVRQVLSNGVEAAAHEQRAAQALADLADCTRTLQTRLSSSSSSAATAPGTPNTPFVQLTNGSGAHTVLAAVLFACEV